MERAGLSPHSAWTSVRWRKTFRIGTAAQRPLSPTKSRQCAPLHIPSSQTPTRRLPYRSSNSKSTKPMYGGPRFPVFRLSRRLVWRHIHDRDPASLHGSCTDLRPFFVSMRGVFSESDDDDLGRSRSYLPLSFGQSLILTVQLLPILAVSLSFAFSPLHNPARFASLRRMSSVSLLNTSRLKKSRTFGSFSSLARLGKFVPAKAIEPSASWYRKWWFFTTLCALVTAFFTPWEVAFTEEPGLSPYTDAAAVIEYLLTAVFVADIFVQLNVAFINSEGRIENERRAIANHYLKLMFWIDVMGVIPFNTIVDLFVDTHDNQRQLALLRLVRLVRVHRLWALSRDFEMNIRLHLLTITLIRNFTIVIVANHWAACIFYYIARHYGFDDDTWIGSNLDLLVDMQRHNVPLNEWHKYVYSLYWSITTMTTVGYGDFTPMNIAEVMFAMLYMLFNIALNSYILGTITLVVIKADEMTSRQRKGHEKLARFALKHRLSPEMQKNLTDHLKFNYHHPEIEDSELMVNLPSNLRRRVMNELYGKRLSQCPVFAGCSRSFVASLLEPRDDLYRQAVSVEIYMVGDEIITRDDYVSCLFVILSGTASRPRSKLGQLEAFPVELFLDAESPYLGGAEFQFSPYTVVATSTCRLLSIPHKTLQRSFEAYPVDRERFLIAALEIAQKHHSRVSSIDSQSIRQSPTPSLPRKSSAVRFSHECTASWNDLDASAAPLFTEIKADSRNDDGLSPSPEPSDQAVDADGSVRST